MELSATTPEMLKHGTRVEGETMDEEQRTLARRVVLGLAGVFGGIGALGAGIVAWRWWRGDANEDGDDIAAGEDTRKR